MFDLSLAPPRILSAGSLHRQGLRPLPHYGDSVFISSLAQNILDPTNKSSPNLLLAIP